MPKTRTNTKRKTQLETYKNKHKKMINNQNAELAKSMPAVRNVPVWHQDSKIEMAGFEFEAIQNSLAQLQLAQQAAQSIMSRNIVNGVIAMDFEKLNVETLEYEPMTAEEKAPHVADFNKMLESFRNPVKTEPEPKSTLVDVNGAELKAEEPVGAINGADSVKVTEPDNGPDDAFFEKQLAEQEAAEAIKPQAKVVSITEAKSAKKS